MRTMNTAWLKRGPARGKVVLLAQIPVDSIFVGEFINFHLSSVQFSYVIPSFWLVERDFPVPWIIPNVLGSKLIINQRF